MISKSKILQLNFYFLLLFPISLIFSKFLSEIIMMLTIITLLINFEFLKKNFQEKWVLFFLLFYTWLCLVTLQQLNLENSLKSLFYIRFLLFALGIALILNTKKKLYIFLTTVFITITFIEVDVLLQFFFGKDIFGYEPSNEVRFSGPFGEELIAGGFLTKFFGISFFLFYLYLRKNKIRYYEIFSSIYLFIFLLVVFITGERMALILSFLVICLIFIYESKIRKNLFFLFLIFSLLVSIFLLNNEKYFNRYIKQNLIQTGFVYKGTDYELRKSIYFRLWTTGYYFIKQKPITGGGLKFYYNDCDHIEKYYKNIKLANCIHPHNIYLDIIGTSGIVGLLFYICFLYYLRSSIKSKNLIKRDLHYELIFKGAFFSLFILLWPLKTSGAFFNNYNSMILYTIIGLLLTNLKLHQKG